MPKDFQNRAAAALGVLESYFQESPLPAKQQASLFMAAVSGAMHANSDLRMFLLITLVKSTIAKHPHKTEIDEVITGFLSAMNL